jgi:hypothetical protein
MPGGRGKITSKDGKPFSKTNQPAPKWTEDKAIQLGEQLIKWLKEVDEDGNDKGNMFFMEFLVIEKDLYPEVIDYLSEKFTSFSKLIEKAKKIQEIKLQKYGVGDRLNSAMTKFVLINNHNWKDKSEVDHTSGGEKLNIISLGSGIDPNNEAT